MELSDSAIEMFTAFTKFCKEDPMFASYVLANPGNIRFKLKYKVKTKRGKKHGKS